MNRAPAETVQRQRAQFGGFILVGIISTVCNLASRYLFELFADFEVALAGANVIGVSSAFLLNRWFVFGSGSAGFLGQFYRFTLINLAGIVVSWLVAVLLYRAVFPGVGVTWHPDLLAHAIGIAVPVLPNFLAHKHWTFACKPKQVSPSRDKPQTELRREPE